MTWAYRTTIRIPIGQTSFSLAFGLEAITLIELVWIIVRILGYNEKNKKKNQLAREDSREEIREEAITNEEKYKRQMARYYNARVIPRKLI